MKDAFDAELECFDDVVFVGRDWNGKLTLNMGRIDEMNPERGMVRVVRGARSSTTHKDTTQRKVWVETSKVAKIYR